MERRVAELGMKADGSVVVVFPPSYGEECFQPTALEARINNFSDVFAAVAVVNGKYVLHFPHPSTHLEIYSVLQEVGLTELVISGNARHYWPDPPVHLGTVKRGTSH